MSTWYPYHIDPYGTMYNPIHANTVGGRNGTDHFATRQEAVAWLRTDFQACTIQKAMGAAFIAEINDETYSSTKPVKVKRIRFVKKVKPASRWKPTWIATRENTCHVGGYVDLSSGALFPTKKEALEYADRNCSRPYWRPGTPKEVK